MDIDAEIAELEKALAQATQQLGMWTAQKLKAEGALEVLKRMKDKEGKDDHSSDDNK